MTSELKLETFLPYRLSRLSNRISRGIAAHYSEQFDLSLPAWRVMAIVGENPGISAADVCERTAMDKVAVSRAVKSLVDQGRLRQTFSAGDKRRSALTLTPAGKRVYLDIIPIAKAYEKRIVESLTHEERETLEALIDRLNDALEAKSID